MSDERLFHEIWYDRAHENVDEWGIQNPAVLLLAMQEEMGELTQAYLEATYEDGDPDVVREELHDLAALCVQFCWAEREHESAYKEIRGEW